MNLKSDVSHTSSRPVQSPVTLADVVNRAAPTSAPKPLIYWSDLIASASIGWVAFAVAAQAPLGSSINVLATIVAIFALLRAALFIHELSHHKPGQLPGFEIFWNAIVGVPLLIPSLMYVGSHMDHHTRMRFGTDDDPEYAPIARWGRFRLVAFVFTVALLPLVLPLRWGVLGPLSRLFPSLRPLVVGKLSTLVINSNYTRPLPRGKQCRRWDAEEAATAVFVWAMVGAGVVGWISSGWIIQWCIVGAGILSVNQLRTLAAHHYDNEGEPMDVDEQLLDSITLRGWPILTVLIAPVGLRYHALHHSLPYMPYHSLGRVHRRLLADLPESAPYRATARDGLEALQRLWQNSSAASDDRAFSAGRAARGL